MTWDVSPEKDCVAGMHVLSRIDVALIIESNLEKINLVGGSRCERADRDGVGR